MRGRRSLRSDLTDLADGVSFPQPALSPSSGLPVSFILLLPKCGDSWAVSPSHGTGGLSPHPPCRPSQCICWEPCGFRLQRASCRVPLTLTPASRTESGRQGAAAFRTPQPGLPGLRWLSASCGFRATLQILSALCLIHSLSRGLSCVGRGVQEPPLPSRAQASLALECRVPQEPLDQCTPVCSVPECGRYCTRGQTGHVEVARGGACLHLQIAPPPSTGEKAQKHQTSPPPFGPPRCEPQSDCSETVMHLENAGSATWEIAALPEAGGASRAGWSRFGHFSSYVQVT